MNKNTKKYILKQLSQLENRFFKRMTGMVDSFDAHTDRIRKVIEVEPTDISINTELRHAVAVPINFSERLDDLELRVSDIEDEEWNDMEWRVGELYFEGDVVTLQDNTFKCADTHSSREIDVFCNEEDDGSVSKYLVPPLWQEI